MNPALARQVRELERKIREVEAQTGRVDRRWAEFGQSLWEEGRALGGAFGSGSQSQTRRYRIRVMGCGALIEGATVTIKQGVTTVATLTTDATGRCSFVADKSLPYTAEVTDATAYVDSGPISVGWPDTFISLLPADGACVCGRAVPYGTMEIDDGVSVGAFGPSGQTSFTRSGTVYEWRFSNFGSRMVNSGLGTITDNYTVDYQIAFAGDGSATLKRGGYFFGTTPVGNTNAGIPGVGHFAVNYTLSTLTKLSESCGTGKYVGTWSRPGGGTITVEEQ